MNTLGWKGFSSIRKKFHVVVYDFGVKHNILRLFVEFGCSVTVVPCDLGAEKVAQMNPDGVFFSNGPGDPEPCDYAIENIKVLAERNLPLFGICLGFQLIAIAFGAKTKKCRSVTMGQSSRERNILGKGFYLKSNHGFMVDEKTLPENLIATHISIFDGSCRGSNM